MIRSPWSRTEIQGAHHEASFNLITEDIHRPGNAVVCGEAFSFTRRPNSVNTSMTTSSSQPMRDPPEMLDGIANLIE